MSIIKTPITVNKLTLKNRLVMPPMATSKSNVDGSVNQALCDYYNEKTKGGNIGLVILEHSFILKTGKVRPEMISIAEDNKIDGLKKLVDIVHTNGSPIIAQINHGGIAADPKATGSDIIGPSAVAPIGRPAPEKMPRAMTIDEINELVSAFASAAVRAKEAGFDGIEIHSAHSYLLNQFYSPLTNKRTDDYGGTLDGRIKLHIEVIKAVREAVGPDYTVAIRLGACDYMDGGSTIEDAVYACAEFEKAGVDLLDITGGMCGYRHPEITSPGYFRDAAEAVKKNAKVPVILTGGITEIASAEELLSDGAADMIGVGRALLGDSDWANKAFASI